MPELSADTVAYWVSRDIANVNFRPLVDVTTDVLASHLTAKSPEQRAELAESVIPRLMPALERIRGELLDDGVEPNFELSNDEKTYYIRAIESSASEVLDRLLLLSPGGFEHFCARVLESMGGKCTVTGKSGDGGIDFVGRDLALCVPAPVGARITVIGQAKRYARNNIISEAELRSFVGSVMRKTHDPDDPICFRRSILAPVAFAFWTTSDFQPSARKFARGLGLWYLNGTALAQLSLRLGLGI